MTLTISEVEAAMREARAEVQRQSGQDYVSVSIEGCGKFRVYIHEGGAHDAQELGECMAAAIAAYEPAKRAEELRRKALEMIAQAERLAACVPLPCL